MKARFASGEIPTSDNSSRGSQADCILTSEGNSIRDKAATKLPSKILRMSPWAHLLASSRQFGSIH
jgi:hypothetical protein